MDLETEIKQRGVMIKTIKGRSKWRKKTDTDKSEKVVVRSSMSLKEVRKQRKNDTKRKTK